VAGPVTISKVFISSFLLFPFSSFFQITEVDLFLEILDLMKAEIVLQKVGATIRNEISESLKSGSMT
jgi:hypothetical protein